MFDHLFMPLIWYDITWELYVASGQELCGLKLARVVFMAAGSHGRRGNFGSRLPSLLDFFCHGLRLDASDSPYVQFRHGLA